MPSVSLLLLTKNGGEDISALLKGVYSQRMRIPDEVIVVDSGSTDRTLDIARAYPVRIEHVPAASFHHARTRNFAASLASSDILVFLSQDATPASDSWLSGLVENFADEKVGAVYGRQLPKPGSSLERQTLLDTVYGSSRIVKDPNQHNDVGYRFYHFSDANAALRRSVWQATGFPEDLKVFEDLGIAKRILDAGWKIVYEPAAAVFHSHHHSTMELFRRYFDIGYTLKHLKIWDAPGVSSSIARDAKKILKQNLDQRVARNIKTVASSFRQQVAKTAGLFLGLHQQYLPSAVKRHLSLHKIFHATSN